MSEASHPLSSQRYERLTDTVYAMALAAHVAALALSTESETSTPWRLAIGLAACVLLGMLWINLQRLQHRVRDYDGLLATITWLHAGAVCVLTAALWVSLHGLDAAQHWPWHAGAAGFAAMMPVWAAHYLVRQPDRAWFPVRGRFLWAIGVRGWGILVLAVLAWALELWLAPHTAPGVGTLAFVLGLMLPGLAQRASDASG